jgi:hypothetical protein
MGAAIGSAYFFLDKPSWQIVIAFAIVGLILGVAFAKLINKINSSKKKS